MGFRKIASALLAGAVAVGLAGNLPASTPADAANYNRVSVHDPSIVKTQEGEYFLIGSHLGAASSTDLCNWTSAANSSAGSKKTTFFKDIYSDLAVPEKWSNTTDNYDLSGNLWAPDIVYNPTMQKYCMYLSVNGAVWNSSIVLCTADKVDGPYSYQGTIVYSGFTNNSKNNVSNTDVAKVLGKNPDISRYLSNGSWNASYGTNAIDPCTFFDENGNLRMIYGSWFGGLYMLELDEKTGLRDYNVTYQTKTNVSDAYMGKKAAGGYYASGEGPYIEYMKAPGSNKGYYYLFISYGYFNANGGYNMRIFRSEAPDGPFLDQNGNSAIFTKGTDNIGGTTGERLMSNYQWDCNSKPFKAQGHNSVLMDDDGRLFCIYHTKFDDSYGFHEVRVHQMFLNDDGWPTATAYEYTGEARSEVGHTTAAVTGEYEFIFHTLNQAFVNDKSADVEKSKDIVLNADGSVTGDVTGSWSMQNGAPEMSITCGGVTYKGTFLVQADESAAMTKKMTFTATGNNTCVWGSKKAAYDASVDNVDLTSAGSSLVYKPETAGGYAADSRLCGTELLSGVSCFISNKNSGLVLDVADGSTAEGANVQQWAKTDGSGQEWRLVATENGYCKVLSMTDESKCMAVAESAATDGLNIALQTYTGADNQQWKLVQDGSFYGIVSKCSGDTAGLDVYDWSTENGGNINQWNYWGGDCQLWRIDPVHPLVNSGSYTVRNVNSGLFLAKSGSGVVQSSAQSWSFLPLSDGSYAVRAADGTALTVENNSAENGAALTLAAYTGDTAQRFFLRSCSDGSYALLSAASGSKACVDVENLSTEDGAKVFQWEYWGGAGQKFVLEPAGRSAVRGDVNADGKLSIADVVMLQKWLVGNGSVTDWQAGDLQADSVLNVQDLLAMKRLLAQL